MLDEKSGEKSGFNAIINLVTSGLIVALIYTFAISGTTSAIFSSELPEIFWIAVVFIVLYIIIRKFK